MASCVLMLGIFGRKALPIYHCYLKEAQMQIFMERDRFCAAVLSSFIIWPIGVPFPFL